MKVRDELEVLAKDCMDAAKESIELQGGGAASTAEQRAWFSVAYRIMRIAKRVPDNLQ